MRGSKQKGPHGGTTSGFQLASCGVSITLRHMHAETHSSSRQGLAWCVNARRDDINNPPKIGDTKPSGWSLQHSLQVSFSSPLPPSLVSPCLVLVSPPLPLFSLHPPVPTEHCRLFLASINYGWNCRFGAHNRKEYKHVAEGLAGSGLKFQFHCR